MKLVFAGTPEFAATALAALVAAGHEVVLVLTQPDRPAGRGMRVQSTPVKALAVDHGIAVLQPMGLRLGGRFDADARTAHRHLEAVPHDAMVVAAYGLILPPSVLSIAPLGCINIHASLLPRWRGAAPIQRAIEAGDRGTGVTIMQMDEGLDTGDILLMRSVPIDPADTAATLTGRLAVVGGEAVVDALAALAAGGLTPRPQPAVGATYAAKLSKAEATLDFTGTARELVDRIRAFDPWPGCAATFASAASGGAATWKIWRASAVSSRTLSVLVGDRPVPTAPGEVIGFVERQMADDRLDDGALLVATGDGAIALTELQKAGGKRQPARSFARDFAPYTLR